MSDKEILQKVFYNAFIDLKSAVNECVKDEKSPDNLVHITECLILTIHLMMDYMERYFKEDDIVRAYKYVNNKLKHKGGRLVHSELRGGFSFPFEYSMESEEFRIVWKYQTDTSKYENQLKFYNNILAGKEVIKTIEPLVEKIKNGYEDEK